MREVKKITEIAPKGAKFYNKRGVQVYPVTVVVDDEEHKSNQGALGTSEQKGSEAFSGEAI